MPSSILHYFFGCPRWVWRVDQYEAYCEKLRWHKGDCESSKIPPVDWIELSPGEYGLTKPVSINGHTTAKLPDAWIQVPASSSIDVSIE